MSYGRITTETMTDIADAIREKTDSEAQVTPTQMPERIRSIQTGSPDAVLYVEQELTEEEKAQARENISAVGEDDIPIVPTDISAFNNDSGYLTQHQSLAAYRTSADQDTIDVAQEAAIAAKYTKPEDGIPKTDLASDVKASLDKADTALQQHQSLAGYATEVWVEGKGYQTAAQVQTAINGVRQLPAATATDNGKFLRVVNGAWAAETVQTWQGGSY